MLESHVISSVGKARKLGRSVTSRFGEDPMETMRRHRLVDQVTGEVMKVVKMTRHECIRRNGVLGDGSPFYWCPA